MSTTHTGSCLCAQVTFEVVGDFQSFFLCHCNYCKKDTGSAHGANLFSTTAKLHWLTGEDKVKTFNLAGTRHVKSFCSECGSAMPSIQMRGKLLVVPAGSLDTDVTKKPDAHVFCTSQRSWEVGLETVKRFEKFPS